eukprot:TRINITY_DN9028_c0_g1_i1.p1 TRINITY_DN9028_c0_g1~~TRINITY_DN9028_c0_g1_i1.p1  ORF type:complete len:282 (-),score=61.14 TRINITY_DN9028_c0_g1_i1:280-1125(-)
MDPVLGICGFCLAMTIAVLLLLGYEGTKGPVDLKLLRLVALAHCASLFLLELHLPEEQAVEAEAAAPYPWTSQRQLALWMLGLHVLYFGLCLETRQGMAEWPMRLLHGPSFGGAHGLAALRLWTLAVRLSGQLQAPGGLLLQLADVLTLLRLTCLYISPALLHQADIRVGKRGLQLAYSPSVGDDASPMAGAIQFAAFRGALRLWAAGLGLPVLGFIWAVLRDSTIMEQAWALARSEGPTWKRASTAQAICLAGSLAAYCACVQGLFGEPPPAAARDGKLD